MTTEGDFMETFIAASEAHSALETARDATRQSRRALATNDLALALERFGTAHEFLHEVSFIAKRLPIEQTVRILEGPRYLGVLDDLTRLEVEIVREYKERPSSSYTQGNGTLRRGPAAFPKPILPAVFGFPWEREE